MKQSKFSMLKNDTKNKLLVNRHHHQQNDDAYITATFWAFFSIGRLISIFIAAKFSSSFMLSIDIVIILFFNYYLIGRLISIIINKGWMFILDHFITHFINTPNYYTALHCHLPTRPIYKQYNAY